MLPSEINNDLIPAHSMPPGAVHTNNLEPVPWPDRPSRYRHPERDVSDYFLDPTNTLLGLIFLRPYPLTEPRLKTETPWLPTISNPVSPRWASPFLRRLCGSRILIPGR
jgi:hypothetical protein